MRASKTVNGVTHYYTYDGLKLVREEWGNNTIIFLYDASGSPIGMQYRTSSYAEDVWDTYYYEKNLQGDILAVYSSTGTKLVSYYYDSWGYISYTTYSNGGGSTGAQYNPLRYRGYYYDDDLDLYYLSTRYYDPETCRFVTADDPAVLTATPMGLTDKNLYAYCDNNPVVRIDVGGAFWDIIWDVVSIGFGIADVVNNPDDGWAWTGLAADVVDLIPFVSCLGESVRAVRTGANIVDAVVDTADNIHDAGKALDVIDSANDIKKIHGNSLKSNRLNYGYALVDENNNILKFGESLNPQKRYTQKFLKENGYSVRILESGSKIDIHYWQYDMNNYFKHKYGSFPPLNSRGW